jgi:D-alanine-D-alanine ligase-like ATP-grasp enzyme
MKHDALSFENKNVWLAQEDKVKHQFARAASLLLAFLPVALHKCGLFTLDAVLDEDRRAWFLEMNSHPMIHPDVYEHMLTNLMRDQP